MNKDQIEVSIDSQNLKAYSTGLLQGISYRILNENLTAALNKFDLTIPEWKLLGQLCDHGKMSLDQLSRLLGIEPPLTTKIIYTLQSRELVEKVINEEDKRGKIVSISEKGKILIDSVEEPVKEVMRTLLDGVSREELLIYLKVLTQIVINSGKKQTNKSNSEGGE